MTHKMIIALASVLLYSVFSTTALAARGPAAASYDAYACTHNPNSSVRMRANAGTNFRIVGNIPNGSYVNIITSKTGSDGQLWYKVSHGRASGWARYDYICTN